MLLIIMNTPHYFSWNFWYGNITIIKIIIKCVKKKKLFYNKLHVNRKKKQKKKKVTRCILFQSVTISSSIDQSSWLPSGRYRRMIIGIFLALKNGKQNIWSEIRKGGNPSPVPTPTSS